MQKTSISATIRKDLIKTIDNEVESGKFRNRSHGLEYYAQKGYETKNSIWEKDISEILNEVMKQNGRKPTIQKD